MEVPPSREVRLKDGVLEGDWEQIAFDIYTGDAGTLAGSMVKLELLAEYRRSQAVHSFAALVKQRLELDGYIVISAIDEIEEGWHEAEVIG